MTTTVDAIYECGKLLLSRPLPLPENARVLVTIQTEVTSDPERETWLKLSAESLLKAWENPEDDVFNELLAK
jgi:predicted DNA-binding antitoxin AbrB/MazE fold protein